MRTYSSGTGARLRFSVAAAKSHDVPVIDEALSTGDARFQRRSKKRIAELRQEAGTLRMDGPAEDVVTAYEKFTSARK